MSITGGPPDLPQPALPVMQPASEPDDDPFCATCGCLPDEPEELDDGDGLWRLVRPCACDCHAASEGMEWD